MKRKQTIGTGIIAVLVTLTLTGCGYFSMHPFMAHKVQNITDAYYDDSGVLAQNNETAREFTDHKQGHVEMVAKKSREASDAIATIVKKGGLKGFGDDIDRKLLEAAALSHDTGMHGSGYALVPLMGDDGKQLRDEFGRKMFEKDENGVYIVRPEDNSDFGEV